MTCVQEIEYFTMISTTLLCVQVLFVIIFFVLSNEKRPVDFLFFIGLFIFHPRLHKSISDCGEELFHVSLLFLCTTVGLCIGFRYRKSLIEKIKAP